MAQQGMGELPVPGIRLDDRSERAAVARLPVELAGKRLLPCAQPAREPWTAGIGALAKS